MYGLFMELHVERWLPVLGVLLVIATTSCGAPALPRPAAAPQTTEDYVEVPFSPRVPPVEFIPPSPAKNAVWLDGSWEWTGRRWGWRFGTWVVPPAGLRHARWVIVRRSVDGQLFFARSSWKDASGKAVEDRSWRNALGPRARARSRPGASAPTFGAADESGVASGAVEPAPIDTGESED